MDASSAHLTLDVRSPGEYAAGHMPHATSLPLFSDEERAIIGTKYKQRGKNEAIEEGLDIVGPKMAGFIRFVKSLANNNKIFIHCWRGGMRSGSMAWLFSQVGYDVYVLVGGYKSYRHYVLDSFHQPLSLRVIGGRTGSGKTELLELLRLSGEQVIDLEALAHHRGSAFGALGQTPQPRTEHFENLLHFHLSQLDHTQPVWIEDESKNVGACVIPDALWRQVCAARVFVIDVPVELRITRLVTDYSTQDTEALELSIRAIERRLGNEAMKLAITMLHEGDFAGVADIALRYYDRAYDKAIAARNKSQVTNIDCKGSDITAIAAGLIASI